MSCDIYYRLSLTFLKSHYSAYRLPCLDNSMLTKHRLILLSKLPRTKWKFRVTLTPKLLALLMWMWCFAMYMFELRRCTLCKLYISLSIVVEHYGSARISNAIGKVRLNIYCQLSLWPCQVTTKIHVLFSL